MALCIISSTKLFAAFGTGMTDISMRTVYMSVQVTWLGEITRALFARIAFTLISLAEAFYSFYFE